MKSTTSVYISLGSNLGNSFQNLEEAIQAIFFKIGKVVSISKVYKSPAWGFDGNDFLNACILVETRFSAEKTLEKLLQIELDLGRKREIKIGYQNRTIDLDILFFGEVAVHSKSLQIPHPKLAERNFVLLPLLDIAPELIHPTFQQSIQSLFKNSSDTSSIQPIQQKLKLPELPKINNKYIAIEGNIGAGKTSLATMISEDYNAKLILERFKDNPFLPKFYKDQQRFAFPLEMSFLADRHQQLLDDISQYDLFSEFVVADYDFYKSLIFAKVTLAEDEYLLYKKIFGIMYKELPKPDMYVYLYQNTGRLLENIRKRGREYEQDIQPEYLENLNDGYLNFIRGQRHLNTKIIDISEIDFVNNREDYVKLLNELA
ncbi:MAG: 2-amino-4-hydroxy-6-hydroxymethyldihydropteridine diphosphokinase [Bacteroidota bacterium]